jgi:undecaprenyl-diphosphatase
VQNRLATLILIVSTALWPSLARAGDPAAPAQPDPKFVMDPVADLTFTLAMTGAAVLTDVIISTGEIAPQHASPERAKLVLSIDRIAIDQNFDPNASRNSTIGLGLAMGFAALDPVLSGMRQGWRTGLMDFVLYAEALSTTAFITDVTKIAVRRPRPLDYKRSPTDPDNTDSVLSYFSGHVSMTSAAVSTATYLAFVRSPHTARPWITLGVGTALTGFVAYGRVRAGKHFPTDVAAGAMAGATIGVLVAHLHRNRKDRLDMWFAVAPTPGGGTLALHKIF